MYYSYLFFFTSPPILFNFLLKFKRDLNIFNFNIFAFCYDSSRYNKNILWIQLIFHVHVVKHIKHKNKP